MTKRYLNFQAKVLIPVVSLLTVMLGVEAWLVTAQFKTQLEEGTRRTLGTAEAVFHNSLEIRARNLILRYQNIVNEPRFKAVAQLGEPKTMTAQLSELLEEMGGDVEVMLFTTDQGTLLAGARRDPSMTLDEFESASSMSIREALKGQAVSDTIAVGDHLFSVVSAPVVITGTPMGALTIGVRIDETAASELKSLTRSEIVFVAKGHVVASTVRDPEMDPGMMNLFAHLISTQQQPVAGRIEELISPRGERFLCLAGLFGSNQKDQHLGYLLLSSIQAELLALEATQRTLWGLSAFGILVSSIVIAVLIRRITSPLRELRGSAEAVGRGDFSKRVEVHSRDEYGELAGVFNHMMERLDFSRSQTKKALQTLKNTQAQLVQREKLSAIGEFVAGVAHELNNPLTSVIGFSEMLQESPISEQQRKFVNRIIGSADRCHRIVQNLLSFARQHPPERKLVVINKLIEAAVEILSYELRTGNVEVVMDLIPDMPRILVDPHQMQQVFLNLINNARQAIEHHRGSGTIHISSSVANGRVVIAFRDDGPGIEQENLARVFDPFFTTKPVGVGTGLGLSLSYGIIREHGGSIAVKSRPGEGAEFVIELPMVSLEGEGVVEATPAPRVAFARAEGKGKRALVIDDEEPILELLSEALSRQGFLVNTAREGESALKEFQSAHYDLVFCDWKIPGLSGPLIFERLCKIDPETSQRFVFMTGDLLNPKAEQLLRDQGTPYLLKPFSMDELFSTIQKLLTSHEK